MRTLRGLPLIALLLCLAGPLAAAPLLEDGFDGYAEGSIDGWNGGSGFAGPWQALGGSFEGVIDTTAAPLAYRTVSGERVLGGPRALGISGNNDYVVQRPLPGAVSGNVYVSMLVRFDGHQDHNDFLALWFEHAEFGAAPNIGIKMNDGSGTTPDDFFVRTQTNNHRNRVNLVPGRTYFLVGQLTKPGNDPAARYDTFRLWVDPLTLGSEPPADIVSSGSSGISAFSKIGVRTANLDAGDTVVIDRLRIGASWADVAAPDRVPVLQLDLDEGSWTGAPGEVIDAALGVDATAYGGATTSSADPVVAGSVGTCRYGVFDGSDDHLQVPHDAALNGAGALTYMAWVRPRSWSGIRQVMAKSVHGGGAGRAQMGIFSETGVLKLRAETAAGRLEVTTSLPATDTWSHIAGVFDGVTLALYVNGVQAAVRSFGATTLVATTDPLAIGKRVGSNQYFFDGAIDEVRVYALALAGAEVSAAMNATRPCGTEPFLTANGFRIDHDGAGIHCLDEALQVSVLDAVGNVLTSYDGSMTLSTSSGRGTWSLLEGAGVLADPVADDGAASYLFALADAGRARFLLSYPQGPPVNVDAVQTNDQAVRDTDDEGLLVFAPSGFTVTGSALANPPGSPIDAPVADQRAGGDFPVHLTAYGVTEDDPLCGVVESYDGARSLRFSTPHLNPATGSRVAAVDGVTADGASLQPVTFTAGQAVVEVAYHDAGRIRLEVEDEASFDHLLGGASNGFVVQPARLVVTRVQTPAGVDNPGASTATGPAFVAAGEAFEVDVEAQTVAGERTPNFGLEDPPEKVRVVSDALLMPGGGRNGSAGDVDHGANFTPTTVPGRFSNALVAFDEVGSIRLRPAVEDDDYLGSGPVTGQQSGAVGRFYPASYQLLDGSLTAACSGFTYMDQDALGIAYRLQALNAGGMVTENYDASLLGSAAVAAGVLSAEAGDAGSDLGPRLSVPAGTWVLGELHVAAPGARFLRLAAPDGPYDPLQVAVRVEDPLDGVLLANRNVNATTVGDCVIAGDCRARSLGTTRVVYGRLAVLPTSAPENENLQVPLLAQVFTGSAFERHAADACTVYSSGAVALDGFQGNLGAADTAVIGPAGLPRLLGGRDDPADPLSLAAPGLGNDGSVRVTLDVPPWLEFDWQGAGAEDPAAVVSFGRYRGHDRIIYRGEAP